MVQKFIVEESAELIYDSDKIKEWKEKCEELGLSKQIALANGDKSPIPFEYMNTVSERVYATLCPSMEDYRQYHKTAIPLEVLSLIALSEKEHYFERIEIWYDDKTPDPIAVGYVKASEYSHKKYSIARWGDALVPFDELKEKAICVYRNSSLLNLKRKLSDTQNKLDNIDTNTALYFDAQAQGYDVIGF
jgi:hypothetical protein